MRLLGICPGCKKPKLVMIKHVYYTKHAGKITGQNETCWKCKKNIYQLLGEEVIHTPWYKFKK